MLGDTVKNVTADSPLATVRDKLLHCCGSKRWVAAMLARWPFESKSQLFTAAIEIWRNLERADWLEAFAAHPRIGDLETLRRDYPATTVEQAGLAGSSPAVLRALAEANAEYERRFGYIFIVCASGKSSSQLLETIQDRLNNRPEIELLIAAGEQAEITRLRLEQL